MTSKAKANVTVSAPDSMSESDLEAAFEPQAETALATRTPGNGLIVPEDAFVLLDNIPDVDDDPTPRMAEAILSAERPDDWARIFQARSIKHRAGGKYRVNAVRKAPSTFAGALPYYLVADVTNLRTGESEVMSISSVMAVLQLIVAHDRDWLPLDVLIVQKAKPTKAGFFPIHLQALGDAQRAGES